MANKALGIGQDMTPPAAVRPADDNAARAAEINMLLAGEVARTKTSVIVRQRIGTLLHQIKKSMPHGEFLSWLEKNFKGHRTTAFRFMSLAQLPALHASATFERADDLLRTRGEEIEDSNVAQASPRDASHTPAATSGTPNVAQPAKAPKNETKQTAETGSDSTGKHSSGAPSATQNLHEPAGNRRAGAVKPAGGQHQTKREPGVDPEDEDAQVVSDLLGHPVPPGVEPVFTEGIAKFQHAYKLAQMLQSCIHDLATATPGGEHLRHALQATGTEKVIYKMEELNGVKRRLNALRPYSVCPWCKGECNPDCAGCHGEGWIERITWINATDQMKARLGP